MASLAVGALQALLALWGSRQAKSAEPKGLAGRVEQALEAYTGQEEKTLAAQMAEIDKARVHDSNTYEKSDPLVNRLRGLVRPVVTLVAFGWYVVARVVGIPLVTEDYAIVGGILAFWFGFRPFEKGGGRG